MPKLRPISGPLPSLLLAASILVPSVTWSQKVPALQAPGTSAAPDDILADIDNILNNAQGNLELDLSDAIGGIEDKRIIPEPPKEEPSKNTATTESAPNTPPKIEPPKAEQDKETEQQPEEEQAEEEQQEEKTDKKEDETKAQEEDSSEKAEKKEDKPLIPPIAPPPAPIAGSTDKNDRPKPAIPAVTTPAPVTNRTTTPITATDDEGLFFSDPEILEEERIESDLSLGDDSGGFIEEFIPIPKRKPRLTKRTYIQSSKVSKKAYGSENRHLPPVEYQEERDAQLFLHATAGNIDYVRALLNSKRSIEARDKNGDTPLMHAIKSGQLAMTRFLLARGADPNIVNERGFTPLYTATYINNAKMVQALLEMGADPNQADSKGNLPLVEVYERGKKELVELFLDKGADPDKALLLAARYADFKTIRTTITMGANIDTVDVYGRTPLMVAAAYGQNKVIEFLIANGANPYWTDDYGQDAIALASATGQQQTANMILSYRIQQEINASTPIAYQPEPVDSYSLSQPYPSDVGYQQEFKPYWETMSQVPQQQMATPPMQPMMQPQPAVPVAPPPLPSMQQQPYTVPAPNYWASY